MLIISNFLFLPSKQKVEEFSILIIEKFTRIVYWALGKDKLND